MALLDDLLIMGSPLNDDIRTAITAASINGSLTQITQISITVTDKGWALLGSGLIKQGMSAALHGFTMEISGIETGDDSGKENFVITARPSVYRSLFNRRGSRTMKHVSPTDFIKSETIAVGGKFVGESSSVRSSISRDVPKKGETETASNPMSSWTTFTRLADEIGYVCFESLGTIYFAKPSWFVQNLGHTNAYYVTGAPTSGKGLCWTAPQCTRSEDSPAISVSTSVQITNPDDIVPGMGFVLHGVPTFEGTYMVSSFSIDLLNPNNLCTIQAATPQNAIPSLTGGKKDTAVYPRIGTLLASDFMYWVKKQIGNKYVTGVSVNLSSSNPSVFDGAELAAWAATQVGAFLPGTPGDQINYCINQGVGVSVATALSHAGYLVWRDDTIAITLGNNKVIESVSGKVGIGKVTASRYTKAAKVPGLLY